MRIQALYISTILAAVAGCSGGQALGVEISNEAGLRAAVLRLVPLGTPLDSAERTLKTNGFTCRTVERHPGTPWDIACATPVNDLLPLSNRELAVRFVSRDTFWLSGPPTDKVIRAESLVVSIQPDIR